MEEKVFDLAVSATAFHWIDPEIAYSKVARALKPSGTIALFWNKHVHSEASGDFFETTQEIYQREAPKLAKNWQALPRAEEIPEPVKDEIRQTGLFGEATVRKYRWDAEYAAAEYVRLLDTYSGNRNLDDAARERLYRGISGLIEERYGGRIMKGYLTILYVARRKPVG